MVKLEHGNRRDFDGVETYIHDLIQKDDTSWLPIQHFITHGKNIEVIGVEKYSDKKNK